MFVMSIKNKKEENDEASASVFLLLAVALLMTRELSLTFCKALL